MPKNIYSKREDLICGKIDFAQEIAKKIQSVELIEILEFIRYDAIRMENKLISYKQSNKLSYSEIIEIIDNSDNLKEFEVLINRKFKK